MTVGEYLDHLLKLGMGWLGWTEQQTLDTSMPAIALAYDGRIEMLRSIFGGGEAKADEVKAEEAPAQPQPATDHGAPVADRVKSVFRSLMAGGDGGMGR